MFIILFGIRRRAQRMAVVLQLCSRCHTPAAQTIIRVRTFFTLFFIPLIPLGSKYRSTCTMCGSTVALSAEEAEHLVASAQMQTGSPRPATGSPTVPVTAAPYPNIPPPPAMFQPGDPNALPGSAFPPPSNN